MRRAVYCKEEAPYGEYRNYNFKILLVKVEATLIIKLLFTVKNCSTLLVFLRGICQKLQGSGCHKCANINKPGEKTNDDSHKKEASAISILISYVTSGVLTKTFESCRADLTFHLADSLNVNLLGRLGIQVKSALATRLNHNSWQFTCTKGYEGLYIICVPLRNADNGNFILANESVLVIPGDNIVVDTVIWTINRRSHESDKWGGYAVSVSDFTQHLVSLYEDASVKKHDWKWLMTPTHKGRVIEFNNSTKRLVAFKDIVCEDDPVGEHRQIDAIINGHRVQDKSAYETVNVRLCVNCRRILGDNKSVPYSLDNKFVPFNVFFQDHIGIVSTADLFEVGVIRKNAQDDSGRQKFAVLPPSAPTARESKYDGLVQWFELIPENTQPFLDSIESCEAKYKKLIQKHIDSESNLLV